MKNTDDIRHSAISIFSNVARENYQKLISLESQQQGIQEKLARSKTGEKTSIEYELMNSRAETDKCVVTVIVFSAMALEAYIYDYAARNLSDDFAQTYLDKLDPVSKWVVIPKLVTGKEIPREHRWFELLKKIIKQRNGFIHHKSSSPPVKIDDAITWFKKQQLDSTQIYNTAREAIELLDVLPNEMQEIDPGEIGWITIYLAPNSDDPFRLQEEQ